MGICYTPGAADVVGTGRMMDASSSYMRTISGQATGVGAMAARGLLRGLGCLYGSVLRVRNAYYDSWMGPAWLNVPVISVGNLTVGGTGKTPMCVWLCRRLLERGFKPAVVSRGYKASQEGLADELLMISRQCPKAVAVANPNRFRAGCLAIEEYGANVAVLDDGFQHRRLGRDLDIVLIDATRPFGFGYVLPRGLLREPLNGLRRADAVIVSRCDQCEPARLGEIGAAIRAIHPEVPVVHAVHRASGFVDLAGREMSQPPGGRMACFAGIARPEAFERTLAGTGLQVADARWWPDHHCYRAEDVELIRRWAERAGLDALVTTEKDAVKLASLKTDWPVPIAVLRIEMEMFGDGERVLLGLIDEVLRDYEGSGFRVPGSAEASPGGQGSAGQG
jgi:tetraacyldisaccharide 4'-kinase